MLGNGNVIALHDLAAAKSSSSGGSSLILIVFVVLIGGMFLLMSRSNKKRQQQAAKIQNEAVPGARVMTTAGLIGTVVAVEDDEVVLEVAPEVEVRFVKAAIGRVLADAAPEEDDDLEDDEYEDDEYEDDDETEEPEESDDDENDSTSEESDEKSSRI